MERRHDTEPDMITISRAKLRELDDLANTLIMELDGLDQIRRELGLVYKKLASTTGMRSAAFALKRLLNELDSSKTPVRPPSAEAMEAFRRSSEFMAVRPEPEKKRPPPLPPQRKKPSGRY